MNVVPEDKKWQYIPYDELWQIDNIQIRNEYRKKMNQVVKRIINPLYMHALKNGFDDHTFRKLKTIHGMVEELKEFYEKRGIDRNERIEIIIESRKKK